jgi:hypothetical protein
MLRKNIAKSHDEFLWDLMDSYYDQNGGGYSMEELSDWILDQGLLPTPNISPKKLLTRQLKQAARRRRFKDAQGRTVRKMLPAKHKRQDDNGNMYIDVVWDYLHEMSADHALMSFSQRDENIERQKMAATRDVNSCLENNPNVLGHEDQFKFGFMVEEQMPIVIEKIEETKTSETEKVSKKKPR